MMEPMILPWHSWNLYANSMFLLLMSTEGLEESVGCMKPSMIGAANQWIMIRVILWIRNKKCIDVSAIPSVSCMY